MITIKHIRERGDGWWIRNGRSEWGPYLLPLDIEAIKQQVAEILLFREKVKGGKAHGIPGRDGRCADVTL